MEESPNQPANETANETTEDAMLDAPTGVGVPPHSPAPSPLHDEGLDAPTHASDPASVADTFSRGLDANTEPPNALHQHPALPAPGQCIGEYELIREIARGGMGVVFLAKQTKLNRFVALKMVLESDSASKEELERFANEARAAGALDHPGIVPVYEVGSHLGCPFFSMAYVDGKSLAAMLIDGPLKPEHAATIARDVAIAIAHAHLQQIIHRDLKPANILIGSDDVAKVTDFGVCKSLTSQSQITTHGELIGTPHYMPPEQAGTPDAVIGPESDVYSIGAVLYAMLTARPPFQAPSPIDVIAQVMTKDPVPPSRFFSGVPSDLETITMKCLAKSQKDRYATAQLLADDLDRFLADEPIQAKPPGVIRRIKHAIRRHVFLASVSGTFALLLVILSILMAIALVQSRAQVSKLRELLKVERDGAKRFAYRGASAITSEQEYDVRRLADAAKRFAKDDPQLSIHLAVYAGRLASEHGVNPPLALAELLIEINESPQSADQLDLSGITELVERAAEKIDRDLTEFELAIYGLFDPSHKLGMGPKRSVGNESTLPQNIDNRRSGNGSEAETASEAKSWNSRPKRKETTPNQTKQS